MEFLFITGHDTHNAARMEVTGQIVHLQTAGGKFFHRELEQGSIVGFVVDLATFLDDAAVLVQETSVGQTALGIFLPGPGVGEVDKQPVNLLRCEVVCKPFVLPAEEKKQTEEEA